MTLKASKKGKVHITNDELSGTCVKVTHEGGGKFSATLVFPDGVSEKIPFGEGLRDATTGTYTGESMLGVVYDLLQALAFHSDCTRVSVQEEDGGIDCTKYNAEALVHDTIDKIGRQAFEEERAKGLLPDGMTYEDWLEASDDTPKTVH